MTISPMWLISNNPAAEPTARCSSMMPEYSMGISHPPNSAMRAPSFLCRECRAVFRKPTVGEFITLGDKRGQSDENQRKTNTATQGCQTGLSDSGWIAFFQVQ